MSVLLHLRLLASCALTLAITSCKQQTAQGPPPGPPPVPVTVAKAERESIPLEIRVVGTASASSTVQVKSQVAGSIVSVHFTEGQNVAQNDLLFEIDSRPYVEALKLAEAQLAKDRAQLAQSEANLARDQAQTKNAEVDAARYADLEKEGLSSTQQTQLARTSAETYRQSAKATQASIESAKAAIQSDQAAIDRAKLDISYCRITAPIAGRTGNLLIHPGNLVGVNGNGAMVVIHQVTPMFVTFSVPEEHLGAIRRLQGQHPLQVTVTVQDGSNATAGGQVRVIDNTVDSATGTIPLKAVFDNRDGKLWPGQFVNVALRLDTIQDATVIPAEAVQAGLRGQFVYVVKADQTVESRPVVTGRSFQNKIVIQKGLAPDETVVTDGQLRLAPGFKVTVVAPVPQVGVEKS